MPINIPFRNDTNTSLYISNLSNTTGKTYRELKSLWDKYNREVQYDVMYNPTKYINFGKTDLYTEVGRRMEEYLNNPSKEATDQIQEDETNQLSQEFGNEVESNLESPPEEVAPAVDPSTEPVTEELPPETPTDVPTEEVPPEEGTPTEETGDAVDTDTADQMPDDNDMESIFKELGL